MNASDALIAAILKSAGKAPLTTTQESEEQIRIKLKAEGLALAQDNRKLRKTIALWVGLALACEILMLFSLVFLQGLGHIPWRLTRFKLEEWTFGVFTSAVLLQTFGLATVIVKNLFPDGKTEAKGSSA